MALPLTGIVPGTYIARATVKVGADTVSQVMREVEVRQGSRPETAAPAAPALFDPREVVNAAFVPQFDGQSFCGTPVKL